MNQAFRLGLSDWLTPQAPLGHCREPALRPPSCSAGPFLSFREYDDQTILDDYEMAAGRTDRAFRISWVAWCWTRDFELDDSRVPIGTRITHPRSAMETRDAAPGICLGMRSSEAQQLSSAA